jgi:hypothetical protein
MQQYNVAHRGKEFGPHNKEEVASMLNTGMIDTTAMVWCDQWDNWKPLSTIISTAPATKDDPPPSPVLSYTAKPVKRKWTLKSYRAMVGARSFIFQIVLLVWTLSYCGWLLSVVASAESNSTGSGGPFSRSAPNPFDLSAGLFSGWICFGLGWCIVGLPVGIAAVATLKHDDG